MKINRIAVFLIFAVSLFVYNTGTSAEAIPQEMIGNTVDETIYANNEFAFEFYRKIIEQEKENVFFSPYSISTALSMTYEGAMGKTAEEIQKVFHFTKDDNKRWVSNQNIYNEINKRNAKNRLSTANALWIQKDYKILQKYSKIIKTFYKGESKNLDFIKETEKSRKIINSWVEDKTNDKIKDLIPQGVIKTITRLVLTNAIYFKGNWLNQFDKNLTKEEDFKISKNNIKKVQMMRYENRYEKLGYKETKDLQILEIPYIGKELAMIIILPKNNNLNAIEEDISYDKIRNMISGLSYKEVEAYIPKFRFESKNILNDILSKMGMPTAFSQNADFSGITGDKDLFISAVIHQAFVDVNEEGTEAAAATAVVMDKCLSMPIERKIPVFRADHPFLFMIQEKETGNILFLGRVIDPLSK